MYIFHSTNGLAPVSTQAGMFLHCNVSGVTCPVAIKSIISSFYAFFSQLN